MDANSRLLVRSFRRYYRENRPVMPSRFGRREFGFMFFDKTFVQRHTGYSRGDDLHRFLITQVPAHCYYSTAYYRNPAAPTMEEKGWLGADLIFDLDADHLKGAETMRYETMLAKVKEEMMRLVDDFLFGDLGFSVDEVDIVFSGGRGYHAHVNKDSVQGLGSAERREIVDYVTGNGLDMGWAFPRHHIVTSQSPDGRRANISEDRLIPRPEDGGWKRHLRSGLESLLEDAEGMEMEAFRAKYPSVSQYKDGRLGKLMHELSASRRSILARNTLAPLSTKKMQETVISIMENDVRPALAGEVDEPVTADIKRLIRLPGSIHGKSGLRVTPLSRDELTGFDPLLDAVPPQYGQEPILLNMRQDMEIVFRGERHRLSGQTEVPEDLAVFLVGRKMADVARVLDEEVIKS
jgi:DNA primase small subunit